MPVRIPALKAVSLSALALTLSACFHPPYNNFAPFKNRAEYAATGAVVGAGAGAIIGGAVGNVGAGAAVGGVVGAIAGAAQNNERTVVRHLSQQNIPLVQHGDTLTLIVPTDRYYVFNSRKLNDLCYPGLNNIVRLLKFYPCSPIYVAGFTDNVGSKKFKQMLSEAQAETMLSFLWAHNIPAQKLHAEGYGQKHSIGDNHLTHGSAFNRRIEIQWFQAPDGGKHCKPPKTYELDKFGKKHVTSKTSFPPKKKRIRKAAHKSQTPINVYKHRKHHVTSNISLSPKKRQIRKVAYKARTTNNAYKQRKQHVSIIGHNEKSG